LKERLEGVEEKERPGRKVKIRAKLQTVKLTSSKSPAGGAVK